MPSVMARSPPAANCHESRLLPGRTGDDQELCRELAAEDQKPSVRARRDFDYAFDVGASV